MKFTCPMCEATGAIPDDDLTQPVTRVACRNCETILLINPDTGKVEAHKSPLKDSSLIEASDSRPSDQSPPVLTKPPQDKPTKDWTAVVVFVVILLILISAGVYFAGNLKVVSDLFL